MKGWSAADLRALLERYKVPCDDCDRDPASASGVVADHAATLFGGFDEEIVVEDGHIDMSPDRLTAAKLQRPFTASTG